MRSILSILILILFLTACNNEKRTQSPFVKHCPLNAPLFTEAIGNELINNWGSSLRLYAPDGPAYPMNVNTGAAYFTAANYLSDAVLLPTVSPDTRYTSQTIYNYFVANFLNKCPIMTNNPGTPQAGGPFVTLEDCGFGVISGYYNFTYSTGSGCYYNSNPPTNYARYSFEFEYLTTENSVAINLQGGGSVTVKQPAGRWYIRMQNSALLP